MAQPDLDAVVVGAGVVGLAVAERLARAGRAVTVLEAWSAFRRRFQQPATPKSFMPACTIPRAA